jgi:uncharacterized membrane protein YbhN (UPF0104 family)
MKKTTCWGIKGGKFLLGLGLLLFLFHRVNVRGVVRVMAMSDWLVAVTGVFCIVVALTVVQSARLHLLLGKKRMDFFSTFKFSLAVSFMGTWLPGSAGADIIKVYYLKTKNQMNWANSLFLVFIDRIAGIIVLLAFAVFFIIFFFEDVNSWLFLSEGRFGFSLVNIRWWLFFFGCCFFLAFFLLRKHFFVWIKKIKVGLISCVSLWKECDFMSLIMLAILFNFLKSFGLWILLISFQVSTSFWYVIISFVVTAIISLVPLSIAALGVREGTLTVMLSGFGVPYEAGFAVAIVFRFCTLVVALWGWVVYFFSRDVLAFVNNEKNGSSFCLYKNSEYNHRSL